MASQVSASAAGGDSFLYSFTPGVTGRGGIAMTPSQPLSSPRRIRTQSMSGEPSLKLESSENFADPPASPRSCLPLTSRSPSLRSGSVDRSHTVGSPPLTSTLSGAPLTSTLGSPPLGSALGSPPLGSSPGPHGSGGIKPTPLGASGSICLRQSMNTTPTGGLPKLDFHSGIGGVSNSMVELPALTPLGSLRRTHNPSITGPGTGPGSSNPGGSPAGGPNVDSSPVPETSLVASGLDIPCPRQGILAPLRGPMLHSTGVLSTSPCGSTGPGISSNASSGASSPTAALGDGITGNVNGNTGLSSCYNGPNSLASGGAGGGGGYFGGAVVASSGASVFPPSNSNSVTARRYVPTALSMDVPIAPAAPGSLAVYDAWAPSPVTPPAAPPSQPTAPPRRSLSANSRERAAGVTTRPREGTGSAASGAPVSDDHDDPNCNTAVKVLSGISDDIQRAAGALTAMHGPEGKLPTVAQLAALRDSAPGLREEIRGAVRRAFQVLRQEVSATAAAGGRQLGVCVEDLGAALDTYLEDTAVCTSILVYGSLVVAAGSSSSGASSGASSGPGDKAGGSRPGAAQDMQRQLERMRLRLMEAEKRAAAAEAAARQASGGVVVAGTGPRPPGPLASPPLERGPGASPRRGRHARALSSDGGIRTSVDSSCAALADPRDAVGPAALTDSSITRRQSRGTLSADCGSVNLTLKSDGSSSCRESDSSLRCFERAAVVARAASHGEMVIEEEPSDDERTEDEASRNARRRMLTIHSASFAEWARRR